MRSTVLLAGVLAGLATTAHAAPAIIEVAPRCLVFVPAPDDTTPRAWNDALSFTACTQDSSLTRIASVDEIIPALDLLGQRLVPTASMYAALIHVGPPEVKLRTVFALGLAQLDLVVRIRRSIATTDPEVCAEIERALVPYARAAWLVFAMVDEVSRADSTLVITHVDRALVARARILRDQLAAYAVPDLLHGEVHEASLLR